MRENNRPLLASKIRNFIIFNFNFFLRKWFILLIKCESTLENFKLKLEFIRL